MKNFGLLMALLGSLLVACGDPSSKNGHDPKDRVSPGDKTSESIPSPMTPGQAIIAEHFRSQSVDFGVEEPRFIALVVLDTPPLLANWESHNSSQFKASEALGEIQREQEAAEEGLLEVSPKIKILHRFKYILNALVVEAPQNSAETMTTLNFKSIEADDLFHSPKWEEARGAEAFIPPSLGQLNSMTHIGIDQVLKNLKTRDGAQLPIDGHGIRVGVVDSGIDYTHQMLGGRGIPSDFNSIDSKKPTSFFPNKKVIGGRDFAGEFFNPGAQEFSRMVPVADENPLDRSGHGTHVAGTIAGRGDNVNTYSGAAPGALLYALKVFGDYGGPTSHSLVIAAMEYSMDPNGDLDISDRLDVLNLSLGRPFGVPKEYYTEAVKNVSRVGTLVVAAAGNEGAVPYIVGSPGTVEQSLSVASTLDGQEHNWKFEQSSFESPNGELLVPQVQGDFTKPISEAGNIRGEVVYVGTLVEEMTPALHSRLQGKIAMVDRSHLSFQEVFHRAQGAIGVLVINSHDGFVLMSGTEPVDIPGIMVVKAVGDLIKKELSSHAVFFNFKPNKFNEMPERIDTLAFSSSWGPRSFDGLLKPEIAAPGHLITSALAGSGIGGIKFSGTSMAAPHVAGVAALLKQYRPSLSGLQIKSLLMASSKLISDSENNRYPISGQGAGLVQAYKALNSELLVEPAAISLGEILQGESLKKFEISVSNLGDAPKEVSLSFQGGAEIAITFSENRIDLEPGESKQVEVTILIDGIEAFREDQDFQSMVKEVNGFVVLEEPIAGTHHIPVLAMLTRLSDIQITAPIVAAASLEESEGAPVSLEMSNFGMNTGVAFLFNLLGSDERKPKSTDPTLHSACDLQSAGHRIVSREGKPFLQLAVKFYNPVTSWLNCRLTVEIDTDNDDIPNFLLEGSTIRNYPGLDEVPFGLHSGLFDAKKMDQIIVAFQEALKEQPENPPVLDFSRAFLGAYRFLALDHTTLGIVEAPAEIIGAQGIDTLKVRLIARYQGRFNVESRDTLSGSDEGAWNTLSLDPKKGGFYGFSDINRVGADKTIQVSLKKGASKDQELVAYVPTNKFLQSLVVEDKQSIVPTLSFLSPVPSVSAATP